MELTYTVYGENYTEIRDAAKEQAEKFFAGIPEFDWEYVDSTISVRPMTMAKGEPGVKVWAGDVTVRL